MNQAKFLILSHSEPLQWIKIGKVANQMKLLILSLEKIGKDVNWAKLAVLSHSEPLQWEKIGKVVNALSHSGPLQLENWLFQVILSHFNGKRLAKL